MLASERKALILNRLRLDGRIVAKQLAEELHLSEDTLRRDLREMAAEGLLLRVHGGALPLKPELPDFAARKNHATAEKRNLAEAAARLIKPGQLVFLDGGTTNAELARMLPRDFSFTLATHSPTIAAELEHHPTAEVLLIGGRLYRHSMVSVGASAARELQQLRPDIFFLGVTGIHASHGFTTGDYEEATIKRQIASQSAETWVLATKEKFDVASQVTIMPLTGATGIITETHLTAETNDLLTKQGLQIIRADRENR